MHVTHSITPPSSPPPGPYTELQCGEPIIYELMQLPKVHIFHLLAAQGAVSHSMEERWFQSYLDHLAAQENEDDTDSEEWERQKVQCKERTVSTATYTH